MTVTGRELRAYARPILRRKTFKFHRLDGMVDERKHQVLELARAFARSSNGSMEFQYALREAPPDLRERIRSEFSSSPRQGSLPREEAVKQWSALIRRIQGHIISEGVYTDFGRPASVGLILNRRSVEGVDVYYSLGESHETRSLLPGRLYYDPEGRTSILIYLWDAFARVGENLDLLLSRRDLGEEGNFERTLYRAKREELEEWCGRVRNSSWSSERSPDFFIFTIAMRSILSDLRMLAEASDTPADALRAAVNRQIDSLLAHEVSHLVERNANGSLAFGKEKTEIIGYLLQAVYGRADFAFLSMANRQFRFDLEMPELVADIRAKGIGSVLEGEEYLRRWATISLDLNFFALAGKSHLDLIDPGIIRAAQSSDHILGAHMPMVEKAMCNPSLQASG